MMKISILGSGGSIPIPRPCCNCSICQQAQKLGGRYMRRGQSLYLPEIHTLFDAPESISISLTEQSISCPTHLFLSHFHPDHTLGLRVIEQIMELRPDTLPPIAVHLPRGGIRLGINSFSSLLDYYAEEQFCTLDELPFLQIADFCITRIPLSNGFADGFLIEQTGCRVFYCPCHVNAIPFNLPQLHDCHCMILGMGNLRASYPGETSFLQHTLPLIEHYQPKQAVITHIEEFEQLSYDDYCALEQTYADCTLCFAYDGMQLNIS